MCHSIRTSFSSLVPDKSVVLQPHLHAPSIMQALSPEPQGTIGIRHDTACEKRYRTSAKRTVALLAHLMFPRIYNARLARSHTQKPVSALRSMHMSFPSHWAGLQSQRTCSMQKLITGLFSWRCEELELLLLIGCAAALHVLPSTSCPRRHFDFPMNRFTIYIRQLVLP